jgi:hypothetical protein
MTSMPIATQTATTISGVSVEAPEVRIVDFFGGPLLPQRTDGFSMMMTRISRNA